jgi:uncharacterized membrane protein YkvA (DUF1232 family)
VGGTGDVRIHPRVREWVRLLKRNLLTLWFAYGHPDTPLMAKILAVVVVGYAFSPIDLIPDFIPVLGYVDELILLPGAVFLIFKLIPQPVLDECNARADAFLREHRRKPRNYIAALVIILLWIALLWWLWAQFGDTIAAWIRSALD